MQRCMLCPRRCGAAREEGDKNTYGYCGVPQTVKIARAALHFWEEPCISGERGSGTVFFSGCNLRCVYCQNHLISAGERGKLVSVKGLAEIFLKLQEEGAHNINLVTPSHYYPQIKEALQMAKDRLKIPVISNTSSYETVEELRGMEGLIDIFLADYKYESTELADRYSHAPDYPAVAKAALAEMFRQVGESVFDGDGMLRRGMVVRNLLLPGQLADSKAAIRYLYGTFQDKVYLSIMNQYTPAADLSRYPELNRAVTKREYEKLVDYAISLGVENGFIQEGETAKESFIPDFSHET